MSTQVECRKMRIDSGIPDMAPFGNRVRFRYPEKGLPKGLGVTYDNGEPVSINTIDVGSGSYLVTIIAETEETRKRAFEDFRQAVDGTVEQ